MGIVRKQLEEAADLVEGDRAKDYGPFEDNFQNISDMWSAFLGTPIKPSQVGVCMALVKIARLVETPHHHDGTVDAAAYISIAGKLAKDEHLGYRQVEEALEESLEEALEAGASEEEEEAPAQPGVSKTAEPVSPYAPPSDRV